MNQLEQLIILEDINTIVFAHEVGSVNYAGAKALVRLVVQGIEDADLRAGIIKDLGNSSNGLLVAAVEGLK
jgi:hypothetical protein